MKYLSIILILVFSIPVFTQDSDKPVLNKWNGMVLDETTYQQAVEKLGKPEKEDDSKSFSPLVYSKWFGNKILKFKWAKFEVEGFDNVYLYFKDDKLVVIELDMKKQLSASALTMAYESRFYPLVGNFGGGITPDELEGNDREVIYGNNFPSAYNMGSANKDAIGLALASQGFGENLVTAMARGAARSNQTQVSTTLSGLIRKLQLISRTLENKVGVNLLK